MKTVWSKVPSRWIREGALHAFDARGASADAAALKLYMALAFFASFKSSPNIAAGSVRSRSRNGGCVRSRVTPLHAICDAWCRTHAFTFHQVGTAHHYTLTHYEDTGWAKLPRAHLLADRRFQSFGIRGELYLDALKLYLALLTLRDNEASQVLLSYDKIEQYAGIARRHIRRAIDVLLNHEWIAITSHVPQSRQRDPINIYLLRGDFWGRSHSNYARAAARYTPFNGSRACPRSRAFGRGDIELWSEHLFPAHATRCVARGSRRRAEARSLQLSRRWSDRSRLRVRK